MPVTSSCSWLGGQGSLGQGGLTDAASNENEEEDKEDKGVLVRVVQDKDKWTRRSLGTL